MGKRKPGQNKNLNSAKQQLHTIKNGSVKKDKNPKFKNTPGGKVSLINNSKAQNKNTQTQKNFQKDAGVKNNQNLSKNNVKQSKPNSAKNKQNSPNDTQNKSSNKKINLNLKKLEEIDDSDSDIDEKIITKEDDRQTELDEEFEDSEDESDTDIHEKSSQDISDDDDDDFAVMEDSEQENSSEDDFEDDSEDENSEDDIEYDNKNIKGKMVEHENERTFKGMKSKKNNDNKGNKNKSSQLNTKKDKNLYEVVQSSEDDSCGGSDVESSEDDLEYDGNNIKGKMIERKNVRTLESMKSKKNNDKDNKNKSDKKKLPQSIMKNDDEDDEDDDEGEESDEDDKDSEEEDDDEYNSGEETVQIKGVKMFKGVKTKVEDEVNNDEDESDEDQSDEDESDEENENLTLGLKTLLGNSLVDDDDDEDFNEEDEDDEDDDISEESEDSEENDNVKGEAAKVSNSKDILKGHKQVKEREEKLSSTEQEKYDSKTTIVVSNVAKDITEVHIRKLFEVGPIKSVHFSDTAPAVPIMAKEMTTMYARQLHPVVHPKLNTAFIYITYMYPESVEDALEINGKLLEGNTIRVQTLFEATQPCDPKKCVFVGNLQYGIGTDCVWRSFSKCGSIDYVHLVRNSKTGKSKGFGFVMFKTRDAAAMSLRLDGMPILGRELRVQKCLSTEDKKAKKRVSSNNDDDNPQKKFKNNLKEPVARKVKNETNINKRQKLQKNAKKTKSEEQNSILFQGQKADLKNKKKADKFDKKKKKMGKMLTALIKQ